MRLFTNATVNQFSSQIIAFLFECLIVFVKQLILLFGILLMWRVTVKKASVCRLNYLLYTVSVQGNCKLIPLLK